MRRRSVGLYRAANFELRDVSKGTIVFAQESTTLRELSTYRADQIIVKEYSCHNSSSGFRHGGALVPCFAHESCADKYIRTQDLPASEDSRSGRRASNSAGRRHIFSRDDEKKSSCKRTKLCSERFDLFKQGTAGHALTKAS
jgi:hypothetical protein